MTDEAVSGVRMTGRNRRKSNADAQRARAAFRVTMGRRRTIIIDEEEPDVVFPRPIETLSSNDICQLVVDEYLSSMWSVLTLSGTYPLYYDYSPLWQRLLANLYSLAVAALLVFAFVRHAVLAGSPASLVSTLCVHSAALMAFVRLSLLFRRRRVFQQVLLGHLERSVVLLPVYMFTAERNKHIKILRRQAANFVDALTERHAGLVSLSLVIVFVFSLIDELNREPASSAVAMIGVLADIIAFLQTVCVVATHSFLSSLLRKQGYDVICDFRSRHPHFAQKIRTMQETKVALGALPAYLPSAYDASELSDRQRMIAQAEQHTGVIHSTIAPTHGLMVLLFGVSVVTWALANADEEKDPYVLLVGPTVWAVALSVVHAGVGKEMRMQHFLRDLLSYMVPDTPFEHKENGNKCMQGVDPHSQTSLAAPVANNIGIESLLYDEATGAVVPIAAVAGRTLIVHHLLRAWALRHVIIDSPSVNKALLRANRRRPSVMPVLQHSSSSSSSSSLPDAHTGEKEFINLHSNSVGDGGGGGGGGGNDDSEGNEKKEMKMDNKPRKTLPTIEDNTLFAPRCPADRISQQGQANRESTTSGVSSHILDAQRLSERSQGVLIMNSNNNNNNNNDGNDGNDDTGNGSDKARLSRGTSEIDNPSSAPTMGELDEDRSCVNLASANAPSDPSSIVPSASMHSSTLSSVPTGTRGVMQSSSSSLDEKSARSSATPSLIRSMMAQRTSDVTQRAVSQYARGSEKRSVTHKTKSIRGVKPSLSIPLATPHTMKVLMSAAHVDTDNASANVNVDGGQTSPTVTSHAIPFPIGPCNYSVAGSRIYSDSGSGHTEDKPPAGTTGQPPTPTSMESKRQPPKTRPHHVIMAATSTSTSGNFRALILPGSVASPHSSISMQRQLPHIRSNSSTPHALPRVKSFTPSPAHSAASAADESVSFSSEYQPSRSSSPSHHTASSMDKDRWPERAHADMRYTHMVRRVYLSVFGVCSVYKTVLYAALMAALGSVLIAMLRVGLGIAPCAKLQYGVHEMELKTQTWDCEATTQTLVDVESSFVGACLAFVFLLLCAHASHSLLPHIRRWSIAVVGSCAIVFVSYTVSDSQHVGAWTLRGIFVLHAVLIAAYLRLMARCSLATLAVFSSTLLALVLSWAAVRLILIPLVRDAGSDHRFVRIAFVAVPTSWTLLMLVEEVADWGRRRGTCLVNPFVSLLASNGVLRVAEKVFVLNTPSLGTQLALVALLACVQFIVRLTFPTQTFYVWLVISGGNKAFAQRHRERRCRSSFTSHRVFLELAVDQLAVMFSFVFTLSVRVYYGHAVHALRLVLVFLLQATAEAASATALLQSLENLVDIQIRVPWLHYRTLALPVLVVAVTLLVPDLVLFVFEMDKEH